MSDRLHVAALMALVEHGVRPDTYELLVNGSGRGDVLPGALKRMIEAILIELREPTEAMVAALLTAAGTKFGKTTYYPSVNAAKAAWKAAIDVTNPTTSHDKTTEISSAMARGGE